MIGRGWPMWAVPTALSPARVTVELELRHSPERSVVQGFRKKDNIHRHGNVGERI